MSEDLNDINISNSRQVWIKLVEEERLKKEGIFSASNNNNNPDDKRPLYERLEEQRAKTREEETEKLKVANKSATLNEEDVNYLEEVERRKREHDMQVEMTEKALLLEYKRSKTTKKNPPMPTYSLSTPNVNGTLSSTFTGTKSIQKKRTTLGIVVKKKET